MTNPLEVSPSATAIVERYLSVLYPFPLDRVLDRLPEQGWIVPFAGRDETEVKLSGAVTKGNVSLVVDPNLKTFGVRGIQPEETLTEFLSLRSFVVAEFGLGPAVSSHFTELRFTGTVDMGPDTNPTVPERLDRWWSGHQRSEDLAAILANFLSGDALAAYGVRVATKAKDANRPDWSELTIAPSVTSGTRFYNFDLIYRNQNRAVVETVARTVKAMIVAAVLELER